MSNNRFTRTNNFAKYNYVVRASVLFYRSSIKWLCVSSRTLLRRGDFNWIIGLYNSNDVANNYSIYPCVSSNFYRPHSIIDSYYLHIDDSVHGKFSLVYLQELSSFDISNTYIVFVKTDKTESNILKKRIKAL